MVPDFRTLKVSDLGPGLSLLRGWPGPEVGAEAVVVSRTLVGSQEWNWVGYVVQKLLGDGTFGRVLACRNESGATVAVKVIKGLKRFSEHAEAEAEVLVDIQRMDPKRQSRCVQLCDMFTHNERLQGSPPQGTKNTCDAGWRVSFACPLHVSSVACQFSLTAPRRSQASSETTILLRVSSCLACRWCTEVGEVASRSLCAIDLCLHVANQSDEQKRAFMCSGRSGASPLDPQRASAVTDTSAHASAEGCFGQRDSCRGTRSGMVHDRRRMKHFRSRGRNRTPALYEAFPLLFQFYHSPCCHGEETCSEGCKGFASLSCRACEPSVLETETRVKPYSSHLRVNVV